MKPGIAISRKWFDEDVLHLTFQVCDGISLFSSEAYTELDWGTRAAKGLSEFARQIHGGLYNLEAGDGGPEYGSGAFRARFHWFKPHQLMISTSQQGDFIAFKDMQVASEARMFMRTEPASLDRFIAGLPSLDCSEREVILECQSAT